MLIILEGADGSGKTTLANKLRKNNYTVIKDERHKHSAEDWRQWSISKNLYILDRSFISDMVYRCLDGEHGAINIMDIAFCLINGNTKIILCETDTSFEDSMRRGEDNITDKKVSERIKQLYRDMIQMIQNFSTVKVLKYNWKQNQLAEVVSFIIST